jgi:hypothetical protein
MSPVGGLLTARKGMRGSRLFQLRHNRLRRRVRLRVKFRIWPGGFLEGISAKIRNPQSKIPS